jgi:D-3-phosphoglycerate dehydrogenase
MRMKVIVTDDRFGSYDEERAILSPCGIELDVLDLASGDLLPQIMLDADGILCNLFPMTRAVIDRLGRCRIIARYGTGFDNVDVAAAAEHGIIVSNVPDYAIDEVAEHALGLLLSVARRIVRAHGIVRNGEWDVPARTGIVRLSGKTLGIVGYGRIGRAFHRKAAGLGFSDVLVYDPFVDDKTINGGCGKKVDLSHLFSNADFISIHLVQTAETVGMIDADLLSLLKDRTVIVNTSRGGVIDQRALATELERRPTLSAGLDVFATEPVHRDDPLLSLDNVVLSPHLGYFSIESTVELKSQAAINVREVLLGRTPVNPVNAT